MMNGDDIGEHQKLAPSNILFVSTANSCSSQMAEGWAKVLSAGALAVKSAGLTANGIHPFAVQVMQEVSINIKSHSSNVVLLEDFEQADIIVTVGEQADQRCPPLPAGKIKYHWSIPNPISVRDDSGDFSIEAFRVCRNEIKERMISLLKMESIDYATASGSRNRFADVVGSV